MHVPFMLKFKLFLAGGNKTWDIFLSFASKSETGLKERFLKEPSGTEWMLARRTSRDNSVTHTHEWIKFSTILFVSKVT